MVTISLKDYEELKNKLDKEEAASRMLIYSIKDIVSTDVRIQKAIKRDGILMNCLK